MLFFIYISFLLSCGISDEGRCIEGVTKGRAGIWHKDADGDGHGQDDSPVLACEKPAGYLEDKTDCDDSDPAVGSPSLWYEDEDGDGYVSLMKGTEACVKPEGLFPKTEHDCADTNAAIHPGAEEICNDSIDNDCEDGDEDCA